MRSDLVATIVMWVLFVFGFLLMLESAKGEELGTGARKGLRLIQLDYFGLEYKKHDNYRDPYFPEYRTVSGKCTGTREDGTPSTECMSYGAAALFDLSLLRYGNYGLVWRNVLDMDATNRQVRQVGWEWEAGILLGRKLELFHRHHSRHILEQDRDSRDFPLRDEVVLRFNIYGVRTTPAGGK